MYEIVRRAVAFALTYDAGSLQTDRVNQLTGKVSTLEKTIAELQKSKHRQFG
jgi:outer membrane murein-binding lipoprotein Lpp